MKIHSKDTALDVLEQRRAWLVAAGRAIAIGIARETGTVHSRLVRAEMEARGLLRGYQGSDHWLGAVFRTKALAWTRELIWYADRARGIHKMPLKVWRLADDAAAVARDARDPGPPPLPPAPPPAAPSRRAPAARPNRQLPLFGTARSIAHGE